MKTEPFSSQWTHVEIDYLKKHTKLIYAIGNFDHIGMSISKMLLCNKILSYYKICNTIHMLFFDVAYCMCTPLYMLILNEILWQLLWNIKRNRRQLKVAQIFSGSLDHLINLECIEQLDLIYIYWISHEKVCFDISFYDILIFHWYIKLVFI